MLSEEEVGSSLQEASEIYPKRVFQ